jgi:hypothetical protein
MTKTPKVFPAKALYEGLSEDELFNVCSRQGVTVKTAKRWIRQNTFLSLYKADRLAIRAGKHPIQVWGDEWLRD